MNGYYLADLLLQHAFNALASFFLFYIIAEVVIRLFRIRNFRLRAILRMVPPVRLVLEPLFGMLPYSLLPINISILSCSHPLQYYLFSSLSETSKEELLHYGLKTVTGKALLSIPENVLYALAAAALLFSMLRLVGLFRDIHRSAAWIANIRLKATLLEKSLIVNEELAAALSYYGIDLLASPLVPGPLAGLQRCIVLPENLVKKMSGQELEAVIAHELEHHRYRDITAMLLCRGIAALFWWVPMKRALKAMEIEQEMAADAAIYRYSGDGLTLAAALQKAVHFRVVEPSLICAAFAREERGVFKRLDAILDPENHANQHTPARMKAAIVLLALATPLLHFVTC